MEKFTLALSNEITLSGLKWEVENPKANLMLIHGAGEHIGRYEHWAKLFNEQNINDPTYILFINFCNMHNNLILESNRINIKIKECFPTLKTNINLGFLAKHLTWDKKSICFDKQIDNNDKTEDILELKIKLHAATNKYYKYKAKYLETKDNDINNSLIIFNQTNKDNSITSSIIPNDIN